MNASNENITSAQVDALLSNQSKLTEIKNAPETQQLFSMLNARFSGSLSQAAEDAASGSPERLIEALQTVLKDPHGAKLIKSVQQKLK